MSHTTPPIPPCNPSTNGPLPNHPPTPAAPTTVRKFLGIPTTTSVYFACTLFTLVEFAAFIIVRSGAVAFLDPPNPLAVLLFASLFSLLLWDQRRCVADLIVRCCPDCESGSSATLAAPNAITAEAAMSPEGEELLGVFDKFQTMVYAVLAYIMVIFGLWVGFPAAAIVAGAVVSLLDFMLFLEFCREVPLELGVTVARGGEQGGARRGEGPRPQVVQCSAVRPSESSEDVASGGVETRELDRRRRLSCIPEEEEDGPSEQGSDNHPSANLVLSQQMQDLVWNRVRYLASREALRERRRKKLFVRRAMMGMQGGSTQRWNASEGGGFSALPPESAQRSREGVSEEGDRQEQGDGGSRRIWERRGAISGPTKDERDTSGAFSSGQPSSTTIPTMGSNPCTLVPQQQIFPAMENPSHPSPSEDCIDAQPQRQQQERHLEAMNHLAHAKESEIAMLRANMEGLTKYFRAREVASRAAHAAEVANAWRNAQVLFEKVGKLEGRLTVGSSAREEVEGGEDGEWNGVGSTEQEERMGRELGVCAWEGKGEKGVEREEDTVGRRQQQQQQQQQEEEEDKVFEEEKGVSKQDQMKNPLLCQTTGCFCHFPVIPHYPQQQQQQQRQGVQTSTDEAEDAIVPHDHVDEVKEDETNDDDDAFTIILESGPPSLSSSSSASSRGDGRPGTLTPAEGSEISSSEWEMGSSAFDSDSEPDGLDDEIHV
ncbi:hypothetical protein KC320_g8600 [Hortaea werneckii]|nr:hypothetical protein KC320_g8600 [Hortaea werneckii]